jgi:O-methyltransferase
MMAIHMRMLLGRMLMRAAEIVGPRSKPNSQGWVQLGLDRETETLWDQVRSRTMTSIDRIDALRKSVEYIEENSIPGDIVECGVWRGGSIRAAGLTLLRLGARRPLWLYDTFAGMTPPGSEDKDFQGRSAAELMASQAPEAELIWAKSSLDDVKAGMSEIGYPQELIRYIVGPVESTIPENMPDKIALLRLDTDWFSSTYHELVHLWNRISTNGILIIDDYGDWAGAKTAVDQYFREVGIHPFLNRIDGTGRLIIKCQT